MVRYLLLCGNSKIFFSRYFVTKGLTAKKFYQRVGAEPSSAVEDGLQDESDVV